MMIVDSSATMGAPRALAAATSSEYSMGRKGEEDFVMVFRF
ncbi:hypothetical protein SS05631_c18080 [Sinorhizobium sp. CCBAU 05631]|nr:hypothetical protein SS05631_c18080 [Sinorhizobium sp. CCBAU 05631]